MSLLDLVNVQFGNGIFLPGAKLYFYIAGTTTLKDTYSNEALTSANANPVVANATTGEFGAIYLKKEELYKVVLKNSTDATIWTRDNVGGVQLTTEGMASRLKRIAQDPISHGAVGDGVTNDAAAIIAAIAAVVSGGTRVLDLLGKTYRCDSQLVIPSNIIIQNGGLDFTNNAANPHMLIQGTKGTPQTLSANLAKGAVSLSTSNTTGAVAGDQILIGSSANFASSDDEAVLMTVLSFVANTSITFTEKSPIAATTANSAKWCPITWKENVILRNLKIIGGGGTVLTVENARNCHFRDIRFTGDCGFRGVVFQTTYRCSMRDSSFETFSDTDNGFVTRNACRETLLERCVFWTEFRPVDVGSNTSSVYPNCGTDYLTTVRYCVFHQTIDGAFFYPALVTQSWRTTFEGCHFYGCELRVKGADFTLRDNEFNRCGMLLDDTAATTASVSGFSVNRVYRNRFLEPSAIAIDFDATANVTYIVTDNYIESDTSTQIGIDGSTGDYRYVDISRNTLIGMRAVGINVSSGDAWGVTCRNNDIYEHASATGADMIFIKFTPEAAWSFTMIQSNTIVKINDTEDCINVDISTGTSNLNVTNNILYNGQYAIRVNNVGDFRHAGNLMSGQGSGLLTGDAVTASVASGTGAVTGTINVT